MKRIVKKKAAPTSRLPWDFADLALASWETIARRSWLMLSGACPPSEYQRMLHEKFEASCDAAVAMAFTPGMGMAAAGLAPFTKRARDNALRLRKLG